MKYSVILCFLVSIFVSVEVIATNDKNKDAIEVNNLNNSDTASSAALTDSLKTDIQVDSLNRDYSIILFHLRSQNELYESSLIQSRRTIAVLTALLLVLVLIIILILSRKTLYKSFPHFRQKKNYQPGIVCLQMMYKYYYRKKITYNRIIKNSPLEKSPNELTIEDLAVIADNLGFDIKVVKADLGEIYKNLDLPLILYMPNHMAVLYGIKNNLFNLSDPYYGYLKLNLYYFATSWFVDQKNLKGIAIQLYPLKKVKTSINRRLNLEKFSKLKLMDRKSWKNYACELDISEAD